MQRYVIRRVLLMIPTLIGVTIIVFLMMRAMPGEITNTIAGEDGAVDSEFRAAILSELGLDQPMPVQYVRWLSNAVMLDFGTSFVSRRSVSEEFSGRLWISLELGVLALLINTVIGIPLGVISAVKQNSWIDNIGRSAAVGLLAAPNFWIALLLITFAGKYFLWGVPPTSYPSLFDDPIGNIKFMFVPAFIAGASSAGALMRYTRTAMLEVMRQDYVRTARSKGLRERIVITRHIMRNALIPVVTIIGLSIPGIINGSVLTETVYSIPGVGRYFVTSIRTLDLPVVQAIVLIQALVLVFANLIVDLTYAFLDPRIRYT
ncbi:MAG: ABC transporter permease [Dehalococcoidia bacterium]